LVVEEQQCEKIIHDERTTSDRIAIGGGMIIGSRVALSGVIRYKSIQNYYRLEYYNYSNIWSNN
jgi:hypothetical protein